MIILSVPLREHTGIYEALGSDAALLMRLRFKPHFYNAGPKGNLLLGTTCDLCKLSPSKPFQHTKEGVPPPPDGTGKHLWIDS